MSKTNRKKGILKRSIAIMVTLILTLSMMPTTALAGGHFYTDLEATITAPTPTSIQVSWQAKASIYRIYLAKGTNAKDAVMYREVKPQTDAVGNVTNPNMNEVINQGIEDNTTYSVWLEKDDVLGQSCTPVKKLTTPSWDVDVNQTLDWLHWESSATTVKFNNLGSTDGYTKNIELYCSEKSNGSNAWYVGSFHAKTHTYTVDGLDPDTDYYFTVKKGYNSYSKPMWVTTQKLSVGAPETTKVEQSRATVSYKGVKSVKAKWDTFVDGPNIQEPIYVGTFNNKTSGAATSDTITGLYKGSKYTTYQTAQVGDDFYKSGTESFTTTNPSPGQPEITSVTLESKKGIYSWHIYAHYKWKKPNVPKGLEIHEISVIFKYNKDWLLGYECKDLNATSYTAFIDYEYLPDEFLHMNLSAWVKYEYHSIKGGAAFGETVYSNEWIVPKDTDKGYDTGKTDLNETEKVKVPKVKINSPMGFSAKNKKAESITLSWKTGDAKLPTAVLISDSANGPFTHVTTVAKGKTSYTVKGLRPGKQYHFKVYHFKKTEASSTAKTLKAATTKSTPKMLGAKNIKSTTFTARWTSPLPKAELKSAYTNIYIASKKNGPYTFAGSVKGKTSLNLKSLTGFKVSMGETYYIKAHDATKTKYGYWRDSTFSNVMSVKTKAETAPGLKVVNTTKAGKAKITITPAKAQKYNTLVYYSLSPNGPWVLLKNFGKKKVNTTIDLHKQKLYFYAVQGRVDTKLALTSGLAAAEHFSKPGKTIIADLR